MPKSRNRKNHKKKVNNRNNRIQNEKNRKRKEQRAMLEQIMEEHRKGMYSTASNTEDVKEDIKDKDLGDLELG